MTTLKPLARLSLCLSVLAALTAPGTAFAGARHSSQTKADPILGNARIYPADPARPWAEALAVADESSPSAATRAPAWASFEEDRKGTLTAGKLAHIAVFDTDLVAVGRSDPVRLLDAKVLYTIVGGRVVYAAE